jgi:hypothetical protein
MFNPSFAALVVGFASAAPLEVKPTSVSMFKNGYATVVREAKLGATGSYVLDQMPTAVLGTFWITASPGVKLKDLTVGDEEVVFERPLGSVEEILAANVGKRLTFRLTGNRTETGTLVAVQHAVAIIRRDSKQTWALPKQYILEIESDGDLVYAVKDTRKSRVMRLHAETPGTGTLFLVTLERGASWAPGYSVDISDAKNLKLVSKATLINDTLDLNGIEARLVTGFPNIPFMRWLDPFSSGQSLNDFVNSLMSMGTTADLRAPGGFGGGPMTQNRMAERDFNDAFTTSPLPGMTAEDLFFYRLPNVRLAKGERGYFILFAAQSEYRHVYEWEIGDTIQDTQYVGRRNEPDDVWHSLKFKNTSQQPFTTAAATVFKNGEILGQDMMSYTSVGAEATVRITKAMDVRAESDEEEVGREREFLKIRSGHYDKVTLNGTLQMTNRKSDPVTLQISKVLTGELVIAEGEPKATSLAKGLRAVNPRQRLEWKLELKPGEKRSVSYTYTVFVSN